MPKSRVRAFTLIELLVVIAIIGMLLAILVPSLKKAKEHMKLLVCCTNLKAFNMANALYLENNDDFFPSSYDAMFMGFTGNCQWHDRRAAPWNNPDKAGVLWPYIETPKVCLCPTFVGFAMNYYECHTPGDTSAPALEPQYSYSQNHYLGGGSLQDPLGVMKGSEVNNPAGVLLWVEETLWKIPELYATHVLNDTCFWTRHPYDPSSFVTKGKGGGDCIATYHNTPLQKKNEGLGDAVFCDGHVERCDAWDFRDAGTHQLTASFYLAWPKKDGRFSQQCPY
jgi:prepilin-type N-terminal cleavage/methylation domain-containing protein/prepilin-type processing-associated H-X9-DG protein